MEKRKKWWQSKTLIVGIVQIAAAVGIGCYNGEIDPVSAVLGTNGALFSVLRLLTREGILF